MSALDWLGKAIDGYCANIGASPERMEVGAGFLRWLAAEVERAGLPKISDGRPWTRQEVIDAAKAGELHVFGAWVVLAKDQLADVEPEVFDD